MLASGPVEQGLKSIWGRVLALVFLCLFFAYIKTHTIFFRFSNLVICGFLECPDSVRTAAAVVIMCRFIAELHVLLYGSTIHIVPGSVCVSRTSDEQVRALSSVFVFFRFFFRFFLLGT